MSTIIAKNQTAGDLSLSKLSAPDAKIPASGQVTLTDYNPVWAIQADTELLAYINADSVLLNVDAVDLTKAQSINVASPGVSSKNISTTIHTDSAGEINGVTEKTAPVSADLLLIEDSAASSAKKRLQIGNLPSVPPTVTVVSATTQTTSTSTTDALVNGMTLTPAAGTYLVWFCGSVMNGTNGFTANLNIYVGGVKDAASEREIASARLYYNAFCCIAKVTVNGAQAIEGRWRQSTGEGTMQERTLHIMKVT